MSKDPFHRFKQEISGAKKREKLRQEKKKIRKETDEYFKEKRQGSRPAPDAPIQHSKPPKQSPEKKVQEQPIRKSTPKKVDIPKKKVAHSQPAQLHQKPVVKTAPKIAEKESHVMPLNKFIAHAGICSRRDAADLVKKGGIMVNGKQVTEPGFKVSAKDEVKVNGKKISMQRNLVYILLNKPKDFITTTEDPQGRKTVLDIVKNATTERVYPIGRLDRNTTGVLLLTNDGELAQKLSHPSYQIRKIYEVRLDKPLTKKDLDTIAAGLELEDGFIAPDVVAYADPRDKSIIGIEIHSGRNRIVRRIFEKIGYDVRNLDRVMYANLTKKNVERGKWRFLSEKEIRLLKYMNASIKKSNPRNV